MTRTLVANLSKLLFLAALIAAAPVVAQPAAPAAQQQAVRQQTGGAQGSATGTNVLGVLPGLSPTAGTKDFELPIQLILLLTVLSLAPAIVILMTSFTRLAVVFGILRTAMGTHQSPPTQVIMGLSLFLTLYIMGPVFDKVNREALQPYMAGSIPQKEALEKASVPMKRFMLKQTREKDLMLFMDMGKYKTFKSADEVPITVLVPAFVISELRVAFQIGFMLFLPFLIVDLIVASVLMSMGMMMLPPVMISTPVKLLLFVLTDGWFLIVQSLVQGYRI